ncbi:MAG: hypothetical protein ACRELY_31155 [Polyangiaceae bacterium]
MMNERRVVVATHGHCFDGMCSAAMFTRLLSEALPAAYAFRYRASGYGPGQNGVAESALSGDVNAILDFRFTTTSKLDWYFDHHQSAFVTKEDRESYEKGASQAPRHMFHDAAYSSCTKLIADIGASAFHVDFSAQKALIDWADMIDAARFPNAEMAVARKEPVLQLMTVVEHRGDDAFLQAMVPRLLRESIDEIARSEDVQTLYAPLREQHEAFVKLVTDHAKDDGQVVTVDLSEVLLDVAGKFVTYALYPDSAYSVLLTRSKSKCKISIGYNPWCKTPRTHNIAAICERYGGGGHPVVGAISTTADELERAKKIVADVSAELRT